MNVKQDTLEVQYMSTISKHRFKICSNDTGIVSQKSVLQILPCPSLKHDIYHFNEELDVDMIKCKFQIANLCEFEHSYYILVCSIEWLIRFPLVKILFCSSYFSLFVTCHTMMSCCDISQLIEKGPLLCRRWIFKLKLLLIPIIGS